MPWEEIHEKSSTQHNKTDAVESRIVNEEPVVQYHFDACQHHSLLTAVSLAFLRYGFDLIAGWNK